MHGLLKKGLKNEAAWDTLIKQYRDLLNKNEAKESAEFLCLKV
jgi:hypothetical protein